VTVFFHHVGDGNAQRDFPRTIGTKAGAVSFSRYQLGELLPLIEEPGHSELELFLSTATSDDFQIWGIPSGGAALFRRVKPGDYWMLLDTPAGGGGFQYIGKVDLALSGVQEKLSKHLWTESRFPLIFLMHGQMIDMPWGSFLDYFGYRSSWDPRGLAFGLAKERLRSTPTPDDASYVRYVTSTFGMSH